MVVEIVAYVNDKKIGSKEGICRKFYQNEMPHNFPV
jgi:hypothetical protein